MSVRGAMNLSGPGLAGLAFSGGSLPVWIVTAMVAASLVAAVTVLHAGPRVVAQLRRLRR